MRTVLSSVVVAGLAAALACAANPKPGEPGYAYNLQGVYASSYTVDGTAYEGTTELATGAGGAVTGDFSLERPVRIVGEVTGTVTGDSLSFTGTYTQSGGCDGTVSGSGAIAEGGVSVEGPLHVDDSCGGALEGSFRFERPAE